MICCRYGSSGFRAPEIAAYGEGVLRTEAAFFALEAWAVGVTALHFASGSSSLVLSNTHTETIEIQDRALANFSMESKETGIPWVYQHAQFISFDRAIDNEAGVFEFIGKLLDYEPKKRCFALKTFLQ